MRVNRDAYVRVDGVSVLVEEGEEIPADADQDSVDRLFAGGVVAGYEPSDSGEWTAPADTTKAEVVSDSGGGGAVGVEGGAGSDATSPASEPPASDASTSDAPIDGDTADAPPPAETGKATAKKAASDKKSSQVTPGPDAP